MKKHIVAVCVVVFGLLAVAGAFGQGFTGPGSAPAAQGQAGGFTGPGNTASAQGQVVTVADAKKLWDDSRVTLQGTIVRQVSREHYIFRDSSGEITVEIDRKAWRGLTIGENDRVEIYGEVDHERRGAQVEIEVRSIRKL
jgi:uncharacterized protein (TIGR00156 family)